MEFKPAYNISQSKKFNSSIEANSESIKGILGQILTKATNQFVNKSNPDLLGNRVYLSIGDQDLVRNQFQQNEGSISSFICRSYFTHSSTPSSDLERLYHSLSRSGSIIIQEINFSEINCFPFNFAIGRFKQLYKDICTVSGFNQSIGTSLSIRLIEAGFEDVKKSYHPPTFLTFRQRKLVSLLFEFVSNGALSHNLIIEEEKIALAAEISNYLKDEKNMISLPGVYQIKSMKMT